MYSIANWVLILIDDVEIVGKVKGGNCTSYAIRFNFISPKAFQLDIIHIDKFVFNFVLHYFSFNDLGNFIDHIKVKYTRSAKA